MRNIVRKVIVAMLAALFCSVALNAANAQEPERWDLKRAAIGVGGHMLSYSGMAGSHATGFGIRPWLSYSLSEKLSAVATTMFDFASPERHMSTIGGRMAMADGDRWSVGVGIDYCKYWGAGHDGMEIDESVLAGAYGGWGALRSHNRDIVMLKAGAQFDPKQPHPADGPDERWFLWAGLDFQLAGGSD